MTVCPKCKFYNICKGRLNETVENCVRFKSVEQTNEEWLRTATRQQLAEWLVDVTQYCFECGLNINNCVLCPFKKCIDKDYAVEWLKQPHREVGK